MDLPLLSFVIWLPFIGAAVMALLLRGEDEMAVLNAKRLAAFITTVTFLLSLFVVSGFDPRDTGFQFVEEESWIGGFSYRLGVDGISVLLVLLVASVMPLVIAASWNIQHRVKEYMIAFLVVETALIGVFCALDLVLFFLFSETLLIPMFLIIGIWGGAERVYAAFKFALFGALGSALMLVAMLAMANHAATTDISALLIHNFPSDALTIGGAEIAGGMQTLLFLCFLLAFAVKLAAWPLHTWLPDSHSQAPLPASIIIAALLLKVGAYGFLRFSLPMFPVASEMFSGLMLMLGLIVIFYGSFVALAQESITKFLAYASMAHMGYVLIGLFSLNQQGIDGALVQMLSHGVVFTGLFLVTSVLKGRIESDTINDFGGLATRMPRLGLVFLVLLLALVGLPGTTGFVGLVLSVAGVAQYSVVAALFAALAVALTAAFAFTLFRRVLLGELVKQRLQNVKDLTARETVALAPILAILIGLGLYPSLAMDVFASSTEALAADLETTLAPVPSATDLAQGPAD